MPKYARRTRKRTYRKNKRTTRRPRKKPRKGTTRGTVPGRARTRLGAPYTYQIPTKRVTQARVRFVATQTYRVKPYQPIAFGGYGAQSHCHYLTIRANCPYNMIQEYSGNEHADQIWLSQNASPVEGEGGYGLMVGANHNEHVPGIAQWQSRYKSYTVTGSTVSAVITPTGVPTAPGGYRPASSDGSTAPITCFIFKSGSNTGLTENSGAQHIAMANYVRKTNFMISDTTQSANLSMTYSAKKWDAVKNPIAKKDLTGTTPTNTEGTGFTKPHEETFYNIGFCDSRGMARPLITPPTTDDPDPTNWYFPPDNTDCLPEMQMTVRISYNVVFTEPTGSSNLQDMGRIVPTTGIIG